MTLPTGNKGISLVEVMLAAAVLSIGTVLLYETFFISLDSFNYYSHYLKVIPWMDERIWQAQEALRIFGPLAQIETADKFQKDGSVFNWDLNYSPLEDNLYKIDLNLYWREGQRKVKLSRSAYAEYESP